MDWVPVYRAEPLDSRLRGNDLKAMLFLFLGS